MKYIYMKVSSDEYELPLVAADTLGELSRLTGASENCIKSAISHVKSGRRKRSIYVKVEIEDEVE